MGYKEIDWKAEASCYLTLRDELAVAEDQLHSVRHALFTNPQIP